MKPLLKPKEVCQLLGGISPATLSRMVKNQEIPYVLIRAGRRKKRVGFDEDVLERWKQSRSRGPGRSNRRIQVVNAVATETKSAANVLNSLNGHRSQEPAAQQ